jgi:hypothetical protein
MRYEIRVPLAYPGPQIVRLVRFERRGFSIAYVQ